MPRGCTVMSGNPGWLPSTMRERAWIDATASVPPAWSFALPPLWSAWKCVLMTYLIGWFVTVFNIATTLS